MGIDNNAIDISEIDEDLLFLFLKIYNEKSYVEKFFSIFSLEYFSSGLGVGSTILKIGKTLSKWLNPVNYLISGFNVFNGYQKDGKQFGENFIKAIYYEIRSHVGSKAGAKAGAIVGSYFMPGVGSAIGGVVGGMVGGIVGRLILKKEE